ncbi:hypothetical protein GCM10011342_25670 [Aquisalinus flavus]|uniref:Uncharacterized protein n=1 Tax=Aquisalinus flavus TaxID=1526572 RepID=A0A8J2V3G5_9PROT|nr:hypothetical protein GCM10011342_25670 [Aquisalinus flavus]
MRKLRIVRRNGDPGSPPGGRAMHFGPASITAVCSESYASHLFLIEAMAATHGPPHFLNAAAEVAGALNAASLVIPGGASASTRDPFSRGLAAAASSRLTISGKWVPARAALGRDDKNIEILPCAYATSRDAENRISGAFLAAY